MARVRMVALLCLVASTLFLGRASTARADESNPSQWATKDVHRNPAAQQTPANEQPSSENNPSPQVRYALRAAQNHAGTTGEQRAAEQEAHLKKQEEFAAKTLAITQTTLNIAQQSLANDRRLVKITGALALINVLTMIVFYCTMRANRTAAIAAQSSADAPRFDPKGLCVAQ
jgi:hypothetical protein